MNDMRKIEPSYRVTRIEDIVVWIQDEYGNQQKMTFKIGIPEYFKTDTSFTITPRYEGGMRSSLIDRRPSYIDFEIKTTCASVERRIEEKY